MAWECRGGHDDGGGLVRGQGCLLAVDGCQVGLHKPGQTEVTLMSVSASFSARLIVTLRRRDASHDRLAPNHSQ